MVILLKIGRKAPTTEVSKDNYFAQSFEMAANKYAFFRNIKRIVNNGLQQPGVPRLSKNGSCIIGIGQHGDDSDSDSDDDERSMGSWARFAAGFLPKSRKNQIALQQSKLHAQLINAEKLRCTLHGMKPSATMSL